MKKLVNLAITLVFCLTVAGIVQAQANNLITENSAGKVKLGMTVAEVRQAVKPFTLSRTSDGEGIALIAVNQGKNTIMTLYAGEENADAKINENAKIEQIEVWDKSYQTAKGVRVGMLLSEAETKYGKVQKVVMSEIESREYAEFANQPKGLDFRLIAKNENAGIYPKGERATTEYSKTAMIQSVLVTGFDNLITQGIEPQNAKFTSVYTDLDKDCKSDGGDEGGHVGFTCKEVNGYKVEYFDSATTLEFGISKTGSEDRIHLATQSLDYDTAKRKIEWRMANGKPFAVIMRTNTYEMKDGLITYPSKTTGEFLIIKGLKGFESIDFKVDGRMPNANYSARELADNGFKLKTGQIERINFKGNAYTAQAKGTFYKFEDNAKFVVKAEKGQRMLVNIYSETMGTAGVVIFPSGEQDGTIGGLVFDGVLTESGDYTIRVSQRPTEHTFPAQFTVEVILLPEFLNQNTAQTETVKSYQTLAITEYNQKIEKAATANEDWVKMPTRVVARLFPKFEETKSRNIELLAASAENSDSLTVFVTDDGFLDDSVRGEKYKFELKRNEQGVWKVVSAGKAWKCQEGRGHQDYSTEPCV